MPGWNGRLVALWVALLCMAQRVEGENWPQFRGPGGQGISMETGLPLKWSGTENVAWKTELSGVGHSSPIVWNDRVFLTATTADGIGCHVVCLSRENGRILWDRKVLDQKPTRKEGRNSYSTPTPITDGERVYAAFSSGAIVAVDFDGEVKWTNRENSFYSRHGLSASPRLHDDLLILPFDPSNPPPDESIGWKKPWDKAFILAVEKSTGRQRWKASRGMSRLAHVTPMVSEVDGRAQLISGAGDVIQGHDVRSGELIWTVKSQGEGVVPSVVIGAGLAFTSSGFEATHVRAVRLGGARGDVTKAHIAWESREAASTIPSFLFAENLLYAVTTDGMATCREASDGTIIWKQRLGGNFSASPVYAEGRIYFLSDDGVTSVIAAGREFKELAKNPIGEPCQGSMAVSDGRLFIRSVKHLYCIKQGNP